jgi:hypothetical protein
MKKIALLAFLSLLATETANAQNQYGLSGEWVAANERCNCGNMIRKPSIYQGGDGVTFTNPCGDSSPGVWVGPRTIQSVVWGINATVVNMSLIRWTNGCAWSREWRPGY